MKMNRMIAWMLVLVLLLSVTACGTAAKSASVSETVSVASSEMQTTEPAADSEKAEVLEEAETSAVELVSAEETVEDDWNILEGVVSYELPLFEETYTPTMFWVLVGGTAMPYNDDTLFWQRLQEQLNVDIDFDQVSEVSCAETYNLRIASGDMTDLIWEDNCSAYGVTYAYPGGYEAAVEDDVYMDISELLPEYAPNYWAILEHLPNVRKALTTDTGKLCSVAMIYDKPQGIRGSALVRTDFLADTGMELPVETDDWVELLRAMKANGVLYPYGSLSTGDAGGFMDAFGTTGESRFKIDTQTDTVVYDGTSEELRAFIEFFIPLYEEGLVSPDFYSATMFDFAPKTDGTNGIFGGSADDITNFKTNYGIDLTPAENIIVSGSGNTGKQLVDYSLCVQQTTDKKCVVLTTSCEEPEKALQLLDWFYSEAGIQSTNYGFAEDESYELVDGQPQLLPFMITRDENFVTYEVQYALPEGPMVYLTGKADPISDEAVVRAKEIINNIDLSTVRYTTMPSICLTEEETEKISQIQSDIDTAAEEQIKKWMTCQDALTDESWNAFVELIQGMGIEQVQEVYNDAYQRYLQR